MKRLCITSAAFLILGAILNTAVAWWLALRPEPTWPRWSSNSPINPVRFEVAGSLPWDFLSAMIRRGEIRTLQYRDPHPWPTALYGGWPTEEITQAELIKKLPRSSPQALGNPFDTLLRTFPGHEATYREHFTAWPMYAFGSTYSLIQLYDPSAPEKNNPLVWEQRSGMVVIDAKWLPENWRTELPINILWPGFAVNTLYYAGSIWFITLGPFRAKRRIRSWHRSRHGLCSACGYNRRGISATTPCPECGAPST